MSVTGSTRAPSWLPRSLVLGGEQIVRDAAFVLNALRGAKPSPFLVRSGRSDVARTSPTTARVATKRARVLRSELVTADAVAIDFEVEGEGGLGAEAGQFMTVHWPEGGAVEKRAYSLACAIDGSARGRLVVKGVDGGRVSTALVRRAGQLATLELTGPSGAFVLDAAAHEHVFFAGGSGITPIASMLLTHVAARPDDRFTLVYGSRSPADAILGAELRALAKAHAERLRIVWAFDRDAASLGEAAHEGVLDEAALHTLTRGFPFDRATFYVCGPAPMMAAAEALLAKEGVQGARIRQERFASPGRAPAAGAGSDAKPVALRMRFQGRTLDVLGSSSKTLLDTGLAAGVPMPYSCAMGGCGACRVRVSGGPSVMDEPNCLSKEEQAEGYVLACCTRATGDLTVEVP
jgi:ring-1,2-phenylacetyl-CoA epoxidase subunit PaaE